MDTPQGATAPQYPRKISMKEIGAQPSKEDRAAMLLDVNKQIPLARVYGIAGAFKPGNSDHGPFVKFMGQFKAVNLRTGEIFVSSTMLLPKFMEEQLHGILSANAGGNGGASVEFAFEIGVQGDGNQPGKKPSALGYKYSAKPLMALAENSMLAALEQKIGGISALPSPTPPATETPPNGDAKKGDKKK
jgi:hypothetical protein